jgi:hypothetical protein
MYVDGYYYIIFWIEYSIIYYQMKSHLSITTACTCNK